MSDVYQFIYIFSKVGSSLVAQGVKDPELSLLWLRLLSWHGFNPWPGDFHVPWVRPYKKNKKDGPPESGMSPPCSSQARQLTRLSLATSTSA